MVGLNSTSEPTMGLLQLASAKFVGKCYMSNFQIQYPTFYEQASSVMKQGKSPSVALEALLNINILDVNNNDPTRYGPARCPWYCVPGTDDWSAPLDEAILTFKLYVSHLLLNCTAHS